MKKISKIIFSFNIFLFVFTNVDAGALSFHQVKSYSMKVVPKY
ncbi:MULTISPECIES: hypothetical protein [unclassified Francisella]|nr:MULTISPECIES: hypothetical protein [unclassified Francisella]MED7820187.1 hypothetical protein [Francisella sp. 19S2-4]MED7831007.1 hypothetical protein [Francisella sp. 19S2-10]